MDLSNCVRKNFYNHLVENLSVLHGDRMRNTVENSEWHREANVFVHTKMVMDEYMKRVEGCNVPFDVFKLGLIACAYHDVGKPWTKEEHPDGGFSFYNHEVNSANALRNDYWQHNSIQACFNDVAEMTFVRFIIQIHLPYKFSNQMLPIVKSSIIYYGEQAGIDAATSLEIFKNMVLSDAHGRISDNHEEKMQDVAEWFQMFDQQPLHEVKPTDEYPVLTMVFGAMGGGKTTTIKQMIDNYQSHGITCQYIGFDDIRNEILQRHYGDNTSLKSEHYHDHDGEVNGEVQRRISNIRKTFKTGTKLAVFVDSTFTTRRRRVFIKNCLKIGSMDLIEIDLPINEHIKRNATRNGLDFVHPSAIYKNYFSTNLPLIDEVF